MQAQPNVRWLMGFAGVSFFFLAGLAPAQGSLTPPGAPGPTMRSLTQLEPRTPVSTLGGDADSKILINKPGSYYLTANVTGVSGKNGIKITTDSVSLDLNGFSVIGVPGSLMGITSFFNFGTIRNGTVSNWAGSGVKTGYCCRIENLLVVQNGGDGLQVGGESVISGCITRENSHLGFYLGDGSIVHDCISVKNGGSGFSFNGNGGRIYNSVSKNNEGNGMGQGNGAGWLLDHNSIYGNKGYSIGLTGSSMVMNNIIVENTDGRGINTTLGNHRMEGNHILGHDIGVNLNSTQGKNVLINNSVEGSTTANYQNTGGTNAPTVGPVGTTAAASNPFSNISIP